MRIWVTVLLVLAVAVAAAFGWQWVVEDPGYVLATRALQAHGARLLPVKVDAEGLCVEALPRTATGKLLRRKLVDLIQPAA